MLGEGGMGEVWLAQHTRLDRKVALKCLNRNLFENESIRERFRREANALLHLQHPNIVHIHDYYEDAQGAYLIIEYIQGMNLDEFITNRTGPMTGERLTSLLRQMLLGIAYAHSKGIIHRDIKPGNFMVTEEGVVKILDFGIAKLLGAEDHKLTKSGTHVGTVLYMSPEQVKGQPVDERSDIYSLGVTLYQMATASTPYDKEQTEFNVYDQIVNHPFPKAHKKYPAVSNQIEALIQTATAKNPKSRFQSCHAFLDALSRVESNSPQLSQREKEKAVLSANKYPNDAVTIELQLQGQGPIKKQNKRRTPLILAGIAILVVGAVALGKLYEDSDWNTAAANPPAYDQALPPNPVADKEAETKKPKSESKPPIAERNPSPTPKVNPPSTTKKVPEEAPFPIKKEEKAKTSKAKKGTAYQRMTLLNDIQITNNPALVASSGWGILPFGVSVQNQSDFLIENLEVTIEYLRTDKSVAGKNTIAFKNIPPHETISRMAPSYDAGKTVRLSVTSAKSSELDYCYSIGRRGTDPDDPYHCY